jgi:hypothetical protein
MAEERCVQDFGGKTQGGRDHLEKSVVDSRMILKWIFMMWDRGAWTGLTWL